MYLSEQKLQRSTSIMCMRSSAVPLGYKPTRSWQKLTCWSLGPQLWCREVSMWWHYRRCWEAGGALLEKMGHWKGTSSQTLSLPCSPTANDVGLSLKL